MLKDSEKEKELDSGLTTQQVEQLRLQYGLNELQEVRRFTFLKSFLSQFNNFLVILLFTASVISFSIGKWLDSALVLFIVFLNACLGVYQEHKAEQSLKFLKRMTSSFVRVIRDRKEQEVESKYLVPGDIIYLEAGTKIPADAELLRSWSLEVNEASLTGESLPVYKNEKEKGDGKMLFAGTVVTCGRGYARVTKIGMNTRFGDIAGTLVRLEEEETPLQKKLRVFTKQIGIIGILASLFVFGVSFIKYRSLIESFLFAVSLAIAVVPEGLPAVMTIILAIGVEKMARQKAIVRKLNAIEALGSIMLVVTDKTGTLTKNQMRVVRYWLDGSVYDKKTSVLLERKDFQYLLINGVLCSYAVVVSKVDHNSFDVIGDPTETALLFWSAEHGLHPQFIRNQWKVIEERLFSAETRRMSVLAVHNKTKIIFTKGAPEVILGLCNRIQKGNTIQQLSEEKKTEINLEFQEFARKGLRLLGFSYKPYKKGTAWEQNQVFLGFVGLSDPVRENVKDAVAKAKKAGISVVMITGDNELTAQAVGIKTGILKEGEDIMLGNQLDALTDEELIKVLPRVKVFARTIPEHKYRLVRLFQQQGKIVGVTGDGVNDALALKQADVGVAMGITGTDVAKDVSDMIITDDNFATIISAIEQGRGVFARLKNTIKFLLSCNLGEIFYIFAALFLGLPFLTPVQLLYVNLITDGLPALALAFAPLSSRVMYEKPKEMAHVLEKQDLFYIVAVGVVIGLIMAVLTFLIRFFGLSDQAQTFAFTTIIFLQLGIAVDSWLSHRFVLSHLKLLRHPLFIASLLIPIVLQLLFVYLPSFQHVFGTTAFPAEWFFVSITAAIGSLFLARHFGFLKW